MNSHQAKTIIIIDKILPVLIFIFYPCMIIYLALTNPIDEWISLSEFVFVPGIAFVLVSIFRYIFNAPRPYEVDKNIKPIINKDSPGKSFPSRHVFSIFIIAVAVFEMWPVIGIIIGISGIVLAYCRVKGGVHFKKDVIAGAIIGVLLGIIGFGVWPDI